VITLLLENGADVNALDAKGRTPMRFAKTLKARKILKEHGGVW